VNTALKNLSDEELVYAYASKRNSDALGILYQRYAHLVYGVCMKYLKQAEPARDATMQIFEKLIADLPRFEIRFFKAWLMRVTRNHCLMQLRQNPHATKLVEEFPELHVEYREDLHPVLEREEMLNRMEEALQELGEEQQRCIILFYLHKKTYTEIMTETGYTFMQVKSYIQNGKRNLKNKLALPDE
jgi:RNA polymerase sigma factor (sigma-70 family)